jgi:hypothetical protein
LESVLQQVHQLLLASKNDGRVHSEPIHGGYANARGAISLFSGDLAYRLDFKRRTIQQKPMLNADAQARYNAAHPGEVFVYCGVSFRRLSDEEIAEICASGSFRLALRHT